MLAICQCLMTSVGGRLGARDVCGWFPLACPRSSNFHRPSNSTPDLPEASRYAATIPSSRIVIARYLKGSSVISLEKIPLENLSRPQLIDRLGQPLEGSIPRGDASIETTTDSPPFPEYGPGEKSIIVTPPRPRPSEGACGPQELRADFPYLSPWFDYHAPAPHTLAGGRGEAL